MTRVEGCLQEKDSKFEELDWEPNDERLYKELRFSHESNGVSFYGVKLKKNYMISFKYEIIKTAKIYGIYLY
jgi:hypothetical protein